MASGDNIQRIRHGINVKGCSNAQIQTLYNDQCAKIMYPGENVLWQDWVIGYDIFNNSAYSNGKYVKMKRRIDKIESVGADATITIFGAPDPFKIPGTGIPNMSNPMAKARYLQFLDYIYSNFPNLKYWQIWNEQEIKIGHPRHYGEWGYDHRALFYDFIKLNSEYLKAKNSNIKIITGWAQLTYPYDNDAGNDPARHFEFLKDFSQRGGWNYADIFGLHSYRHWAWGEYRGNFDWDSHYVWTKTKNCPNGKPCDFIPSEWVKITYRDKRIADLITGYTKNEFKPARWITESNLICSGIPNKYCTDVTNNSIVYQNFKNCQADFVYYYGLNSHLANNGRYRKWVALGHKEVFNLSNLNANPQGLNNIGVANCLVNDIWYPSNQDCPNCS